MTALLAAALSDLQEDLTRLRQLLSLVQLLREFGSVDEPVRTTLDGFDKQAVSLRTRIRLLSSDVPVLSGTLLLFLAGRFEHFVRMSFQAHCDSVAQKCQRFDELPAKMQQSLRYHTAEVALSPSKYGFDNVAALGFIVGLAGNISATAGVGAINSACLSVTQNNMTSHIIAELYKRIGVQNLWSELAKQAGLKIHFGVEKDGDAERSAKAVLDEIMSTRNQIAHPNGSLAFPGPEKVSAYVDFVDVLARTLTDVSKVALAAFKPSAESVDDGGATAA